MYLINESTIWNEVHNNKPLLTTNNIVWLYVSTITINNIYIYIYI